MADIFAPCAKWWITQANYLKLSTISGGGGGGGGGVSLGSAISEMWGTFGKTNIMTTTTPNF